MSGGTATDPIHHSTGWGIDAAERVPSRTGAKPELGFLFILILPALAAIASFKNITVLGANYLAFLTLLVPLTLCLLILVKAGLDSSRVRLWPAHSLWLIWYAVVWCSLLWGESRDEDAVQFAFELSTPYLFAIGGAMFVRNGKQLAWLINAFLIALPVSLSCVVAWKIGIVDAGSFASGPALDARPHSMSLLPIAALAVAMFPGRGLLSLVAWALCLLISAVEGSRGATLCMLLMPMFHPSLGGSLLKGIAWRGLALVAIAAMAWAVFHLPMMQSRLFPDTGSGQVSDLFESNVSGMGRFEAWPIILERALDRPVLGHGVSTVGDFVPTIWDRMESPHNEFLRIGYEYGLLGIIVFVAAVSTQLIFLKRSISTASSTRALALSAVYLGLIGFLIMACSDNPLASNVRFLNPLFLLLGAAYYAEYPRSSP